MKLIFVLPIYLISKISALGGKLNYNQNDTKCQSCKQFAERFRSGMTKTHKKNFSGGDTSWVEAKRMKYSTSEARFDEVTDGICKNDFGCSTFFEEYEEDVEDWFFKHNKEDNAYKLSKIDDHETDNYTFYQHLCVNKLKFCCKTRFQYGKKCSLCPGTNSKKVSEITHACNNFGTCEIFGTKKTKMGECKCTDNHEGKACESCKKNYFMVYEKQTGGKKEKNAVKVVGKCKKCHKSCKEQCDGPSEYDCIGKEPCKIGYTTGGEIGKDGTYRRKCIDINECIKTPDICGPGKFCQNTEGSKSCLNCSRSCATCVKFGMCTSCAEGYKRPEEEMKNDNPDTLNESSESSKSKVEPTQFYCQKISSEETEEIEPPIDEDSTEEANGSSGSNNFDDYDDDQSDDYDNDQSENDKDEL